MSNGARAAYEAFLRAQSVEPSLRWEALDDVMRNAWEAAVKAAIAVASDRLIAEFEPAMVKQEREAFDAVVGHLQSALIVASEHFKRRGS